MIGIDNSCGVLGISSAAYYILFCDDYILLGN